MFKKAKANRTLFVNTYVALALSLLLLLPHCVLAEDRFLLGDSSPQPLSVTQAGGMLYVMTNEGLWSYPLQSDEPPKKIGLSMADISIDSLLFHGDHLMLFDPVHRKIWEYDQQGFQLVQDVSGTILDNPAMVYQFLVYQNGYLFLLGLPQGGFPEQSNLIKFCLEDSTAESFPIQGLVELTEHSDGGLLALQMVRRDSGTALYEIITIDTQSGGITDRVATLSNINDGSLAFNHKDGKIYALVDGMVSWWTGMGWEKIRSVPTANNPFYAGAFGSLYITASMQGIAICDLAQAREQVTLTIKGIHPIFSVDYEFSASHSNVAVSRAITPHYCADEVYQAVQTGDDTTDIFLVRLSVGLQNLMKKGYLEPLSSSRVLLEDHERLHPSIAAHLMLDTTLYAIPSGISVDVWRMRSDIQADIAPPKTVEELMLQQRDWESHPSNDGVPWVAQSFSVSPWGHHDYARHVLTQYVMAQADQEGALSFSDSALMGLLEAIRSDIDGGENGNERGNLEASGAVVAGASDSLEGSINAEFPMVPPPAIFSGASTHVPADLFVYVLNPYSKNKEAAKEYLEYVATHRELFYQGLLHADITQGVLWPGLEEELGAMQDLLTSANARLARTAPEDQKDVKSEIEQITAQIESINGSPSCWRIYGPALDCYQSDIAPYLDFGLSPYLGDLRVTHATVYNDMMKILQQYMDGAISLDACLQKLDAISSLIFAESDG